MALRYRRKRLGAKNSYTTITRTTSGSSISHTNKIGGTTVTTNKRGTRITNNLGNGISSVQNIPGRSKPKLKSPKHKAKKPRKSVSYNIVVEGTARQNAIQVF
jgi:hypothetical protein